LNLHEEFHFLRQKTIQSHKEARTSKPSHLARLVTLLVLLFVLGQWLGLIGLALAVLVSTIIESMFLFGIYLNSKPKTLDNKN